MSRKNFNKSGVPWYARSDMSVLKDQPQKPRETREAERAGRVAQRAARTYIREYLEKEWQEGDRFIVLLPTHVVEKTLSGGSLSPLWGHGMTGTYKRLQPAGLCDMVMVDWDGDPKQVKWRLGATQNWMGSCYFYANAYRQSEVCEEDVQRSAEEVKAWMSARREVDLDHIERRREQLILRRMQLMEEVEKTTKQLADLQDQCPHEQQEDMVLKGETQLTVKRCFHCGKIFAGQEDIAVP